MMRTRAHEWLSCSIGAGHSLVSNIIDPDQTEDGMIVAYGVCQQLDDMKHTYHGLPDFLTKVLLANVGLHNTKCNIC